MDVHICIFMCRLDEQSHSARLKIFETGTGKIGFSYFGFVFYHFVFHRGLFYQLDKFFKASFVDMVNRVLMPETKQN